MGEIIGRTESEIGIDSESWLEIKRVVNERVRASVKSSKGKSEPFTHGSDGEKAVQSGLLLELDRGKYMLTPAYQQIRRCKIPFSSASSVFISPEGPVQRS